MDMRDLILETEPKTRHTLRETRKETNVVKN